MHAAYAVRLLVVVGLALVTQACGDDFDDYGLLSANDACGGESSDEANGGKEEQALMLNGDRSKEERPDQEKPAKDMNRDGNEGKQSKEKSGGESDDCSAQSDEEK